MKVYFFSPWIRRAMGYLSAKRSGRGLDVKKWDNIYDTVLYGRVARYSDK